MNINRITGLASGLDTQQMIQDLMKAHRKPLDKLKQQRQLLEWKREDFRSINSSLLSFRQNAVFPMRLSSTFLARSALSSNTSVVTATANTAAANATYSVSVTSLATTAYKTSTVPVSAASGNKVDPGQSLWSQRAKFGDTNFNWKMEAVSGETIAGTDSASYQLANTWVTSGSAAVKVVLAGGGEQAYTVYYSEADYNTGLEVHKVWLNTETGALQFNQVIATGDTIEANYEYNTRTFDFDVTTYKQDGTAVNKTIEVSAVTDTLHAVLNRISADTDLGLTAFYEGSADKVSLSTTRTGNNNALGDEIKLGTTGFLAQVLRLGDAVEVGGTNAVLNINGLDIVRATNEFTVNDVNFTLKGSGTATVTVRGDTESVFQSIKAFIDGYNSLLDQFNGKLQEKRFQDYLPLLEDDPARENLTEKQIDQWQEKARSGLLRGDSILDSIVTRLRNDVFSSVSGLDPSLNHLTHIGIKIGSREEHGRLVIDEGKLRAAIEQDPEGVARIFNKNGSTSAEEGIGRRLYNYLDSAIKRVTAHSGSSATSSLYDQSWLGRQIDALGTQVSRTEQRLEKLENRYWKQFSALEQAIARTNSQSMWLMQQMGSGQT
ncbi:MAG: hypothetical protein C4575_01630 [Desulforudis sp.]|nr:MAG: hypothetical protein C4575_01630 [Desulforudis sp.]